MKILQINIRVNKGSASRITEQIGCKILKEGWESYIAYGRPSNPSESKLIQIGSNKDVRTHYILSLLTDSEGLHSVRSTKQLVSEIQRIKPDIIHLQNIHGHYLNYKILFEYLNSTATPVVWTLHDCWAFTGHCAHFVTAGCEKWKVECHDCPLKKSYPKSLWLDKSTRNFRLKQLLFTANKHLHIVTVSRWLADMAKQSFLRSKDIRVISNGIDLGIFTPGHSNITSFKDKFMILAAATTWTEGKGLSYYKQLSSKLNIDEVIVLVGIGADKQKSMPSNIICIDKTKTTLELADYYRRADVLMSLSKAETFGLTIVEAMACGTPVIVNNNTAQPELVNDSVGLIVDASDTEQLYRAIQEIRNRGKNYYYENCLKQASYYNKDDQFNEYIKLYKELC